MNPLERMRRAVLNQRYRISTHAIDELSDDQLESMDVEHVILSGRITHVLTGDPRGTRYEVTGEACNGRLARVVCRFLLSGVLLIITAYAVEE